MILYLGTGSNVLREPKLMLEPAHGAHAQALETSWRSASVKQTKCWRGEVLVGVPMIPSQQIYTQGIYTEDL